MAEICDPTFRFLRLQVLQATGMIALCRNSIGSECNNAPLRSVGVGLGSNSGSFEDDGPGSIDERCPGDDSGSAEDFNRYYRHGSWSSEDFKKNRPR
jgi:hypothetical protein